MVVQGFRRHGDHLQQAGARERLVEGDLDLAAAPVVVPQNVHEFSGDGEHAEPVLGAGQAPDGELEHLPHLIVRGRELLSRQKRGVDDLVEPPFPHLGRDRVERDLLPQPRQ